MAIAFNLPSERETTEENFSRLNRLLAELYDVLCHILVARQPGQEAHDNRRDRPYSESDVERAAPQPPPLPCRLSASSPPVAIGLDAELDDDVFVSPRTDNGNDLFSTRNLEIFGYRSPRTPAGVLLSSPRDTAFTFSVTTDKHLRDKGGTDVADGVATDNADETDAVPSEEAADPTEAGSSSEGSIFSSIIPHKVSGSICTAILLMLGWKLLSHKR